MVIHGLPKETPKPKRTCDHSQHAELCKRAERWLLNTLGCRFAFCELRSIAGEQPDAIGWRDGATSYLVECKTSRSDFKKDAEKYFRRRPEQGMGAYRYMMCPPDLIKPDELPEGWGLLYCLPRIVKRIVEPQLAERSMSAEMTLLCSALRRIHQHGDLQKIYETVGKDAA